MLAVQDFDRALFRLNNATSLQEPHKKPQLHPVLADIEKHIDQDRLIISLEEGNFTTDQEIVDIVDIMPLLNTSVAKEAASIPPQKSLELRAEFREDSLSWPYSAIWALFAQIIYGTGLGGFVTVRDVVHGVLSQRYKEQEYATEACLPLSLQVHFDDVKYHILRAYFSNL